jgi:hypothetical protein
MPTSSVPRRHSCRRQSPFPFLENRGALSSVPGYPQEVPDKRDLAPAADYAGDFRGLVYVRPKMRNNPKLIRIAK